MKNKILFFATLLLLCIINSAQAQDTLKVKVYLEGLYRGNGMMDAAPFNSDGISPNDIADTITLKLFAYDSNLSSVVDIPSYIRRGLLKTNGYATFILPSFLTNTSYLIQVSHRNSIEIYSSSYVFIHSGTTIYDFTDSLTKVWGADQKDLGNGVYGMYAGDINQDGSVDFNDYPDLDIASSIGLLGYEPFDLNGDASVDFNDYPIIDVNTSNGIVIGIFINWPITFIVTKTLKAADVFAGGVVAYILQPGDQGYVAGEIHGLIVAPTDISGMPEWGCSGTNVVATSNGVGSGMANTTKIVNACNASGIAARLCDDLVLNGYNDWYLPSLEELDKFYQITTINLGRQLSPYWSSSQYDANNSWTELTNSGQYLSQQKSGNHYVRAFRSF